MRCYTKLSWKNFAFGLCHALAIIIEKSDFCFSPLETWFFSSVYLIEKARYSILVIIKSAFFVILYNIFEYQKFFKFFVFCCFSTITKYPKSKHTYILHPYNKMHRYLFISFFLSKKYWFLVEKSKFLQNIDFREILPCICRSSKFGFRKKSN